MGPTSPPALPEQVRQVWMPSSSVRELERARCHPGNGESRGASAEGTCLRDTLKHTLLSCAIGLCKYNAVFIRWERRAQGWTPQRHE